MGLIAKGLGRLVIVAVGGLLLYLGFVIVYGTVSGVRASGTPDPDQANRTAAGRLFEQGKAVFRFDTFGDEAFWGDQLQLHRAIEGERLGGVGPGVSPKTALAVGLKVDSQALPDSLRQALAAGRVNLDDPATTLALLKLNAVVGLKGFFNSEGTLSSVGITCASCHSIVDDSFAPGIGRRLDGWPNRDLDVGAIVSLAPNKTPLTDLLGVDETTLNSVLAAWGPGKFDAELFLDGKGFRPDGKTAAVLIPPAFGLAGVNLHTYTGWGSVTYWNAFVANLEMHGKGSFFDPRLNDPAKFPIAAAAGFANVRTKPDLITPKLAALHVYQLALEAPRPPNASFDAAVAQRGKEVFNGIGKCASCHVAPLFSEPGQNLHPPAEICTDSFQADRSPTGMYRTTPLKGLFAHAKGGFWHDGRFASLDAVVEHYDSCFGLGLTTQQQADLVQYLKSL
jgi:mono/diheme cytochrome c family protein